MSESVPVTHLVEPEAINTYAIMRASQMRLRGEEVTPYEQVPRDIHYPDMPPSFGHENPEAYTDRLLGRHGNSPYDHHRLRQCSIGYHNECSERHGMIVPGDCECPCHVERAEGPQAGVTMTDAAARLGRLYFLPSHTAKIVMATVRTMVLMRATLGETPDDSEEPPDYLPFEKVKDLIAGARPHHSRPGDWFTVDVLRLGGLDKFVKDMP